MEENYDWIPTWNKWEQIAKDIALKTIKHFDLKPFPKEKTIEISKYISQLIEEYNVSNYIRVRNRTIRIIQRIVSGLHTPGKSKI